MQTDAILTHSGGARFSVHDHVSPAWRRPAINILAPVSRPTKTIMPEDFFLAILGSSSS